MQKDVIELMEATIKGALVASMANIKDDVLAKLVDNVLDKKVTVYGAQPSAYDRDTITYLDYLFNCQLQRIINQVIQDLFSSKEVDLKQKIKDELLKEGGLADKIALNITNHENWDIIVNVTKKGN